VVRFPHPTKLSEGFPTGKEVDMLAKIKYLMHVNALLKTIGSCAPGDLEEDVHDYVWRPLRKSVRDSVSLLVVQTGRVKALYEK
jgi:hypothetical protein